MRVKGVDVRKIVVLNGDEENYLVSINTGHHTVIGDCEVPN